MTDSPGLGDMDPIRAAEKGVAAVAPAPVEAWEPPSPKSAATVRT
jgi:hypothetical protein